MINKRLTLILFFLVAVGICTGSFFEIYMSGPGKDEMMELLSAFFSGQSGGTFFGNFFSCLKIWLVILAVMLVGPIVPVSAALFPLLPLGKGLALGFSATMLMETFGAKGAWYILATMIPQSIIQIPVLCIMSGLAMRCSILVFKCFFSRRRRTATKNALQSYARQYVLYLGVALGLLVISCLVEALLMKALL